MRSKTKTTATKDEARPVLVPKLRFPEFREAVTPELLAGLGTGALQPLISSPSLLKRETLSPESGIVETATPQLIFRFFTLTTPKAALEMERFITQIGKEVGA